MPTSGKDNSASGLSNMVPLVGESSKVTQSATSARKMRAGKGVANEEPNSHLKMVIEKLKQVFSEEKCNKDTNAGMDYLIQLVIASLGEVLKKLLKRLLCCLPELGISFFVQRFHWAVSKVKQVWFPLLLLLFLFFHEMYWGLNSAIL
ncbi:hypothetical protein LWI28_014623 [Acer negundo]|uniref:Uncharacterized protein n=1 Tax=Acer negundo TaxID=4023 RepID=A0AAD5J630_ACENE|nr:hypothetical protein LWI28_014623 [Acer negundo]